MKYLKMLMLPLSLILMVGCEDDGVVFDCTKAEADLSAHPFAEYTLAYSTAATSGTAYTFPGDWTSQCGDYYDDLQEAVDEGCVDGVTSQDVTGGRVLCTINGG